MIIKRVIEEKIKKILEWSPSVTLLGPRQIGKTTLANILKDKLNKESIYLDLENIDDYKKISYNKLFFEENKEKCIILDEIQKYPELFSQLRSTIDNHRCSARFIILGSASPIILKKATESLTGRTIYIEINGINVSEVNDKEISHEQQWFRGGYPIPLMQESNNNRNIWFKSYLKNYIEFDLPQIGLNVPSLTMYRMLSMLANSNGSLWNSANLSNSLMINTRNLALYRDYLEKTFLIRVLPPFYTNIKKRLIKSPKVYLKDSGILHYLTRNYDFNSLLGHPIVGMSWEGYVMEQIINFIENNNTQDYEYCFYRTKDGSEVDLVILKGYKPYISVEIKLGSTPTLSRGSSSAIKYLETKHNYVIVLKNEFMYTLNNGFKVVSLTDFFNELKIIDV